MKQTKNILLAKVDRLTRANKALQVSNDTLFIAIGQIEEFVDCDPHQLKSMVRALRANLKEQKSMAEASLQRATMNLLTY